MLYTRKGDNGTTKAFNCDQRMSKSSLVAEALGALDEVNSFLGLVKVKVSNIEWTANGKKLDAILDWAQNCLFIVQAEVAGADKSISGDKVIEIESIVDAVEKEMPPIKTFFVSGGTEIAALLDVSRTLARRAERRVVAVTENGDLKIGAATLAFLNRLSSLFYALARLSNHKSGIKEVSPRY